MTVVTLSRQLGSGGDEIAARVCELLAYRYFDKQLMIEAAADAGLRENEVVDFCEDKYIVKDFLSRVFRDKPRTVKHLLIREEEHGPIEPLSARTLNEAECVDLVRYTVVSAYQQGGIVIMGRGGQAILRDKPGALHVRVVAPYDLRIQRLRSRGMSGISQIKAYIAQQDRASAEYLHRFFGIQWDDPTNYHLVINTGLTALDTAARIIADAVRQIEAAAIA
jgi:cytidylate kinase